MLKLFSRSKHEESELNSVLKIRNQRKDEHKVEEKGTQLKFGRIDKFSQPAKFRRLATYEIALQFLSLFPPCDTVHATF